MRSFRWVCCSLLLAIFCALAISSPVAAQSVPTGFQEYFVLGNEQHLWDMLTRVQTGEGGGGFASGMNSVVSATASADNQVVTYDHWEDGLEVDITNPVQATTLVIGDGNNANGRACDFTTDPRIFPCNGTNDDLLFAGSFLNFNSDQGLGCAAPPADLNCSVPVNPRVVTDIRYDGGDFLTSSGGPLSLVHPQDPLSPFIGGATEIIPRQAVAAATSYTIPIGEDIYAGNNTVTEPFKYVDLNLVAFDDNTQVNIISPGAGNVAFTLNRGQHYSSRGFIDNAAAAGIVVNAGTRISTTAPIGGLIFTGGDGTFATRFYTLLPDILHSTDYIITAPGDDPVPQGSRPLNLYIFNPDPLNALAVTATDSAGTTIINIPASSQVDYFTGTGRFVPANSTVRLTSDRRFWGVSAYSHQSPANDWGHSWLAREFVTSTYTVPFAPGVNNPAFESTLAQRTANDPACTIPPAGPGVCDPLNRSPVFVSATADNTEIQIDFDNDGIFDIIDLDGDDFPDPAPGPDPTLYVINALQALRVYDHNDYDNTGTLVVGNKPIAVSYGEDTDQATGPDPIQDTGYAIYPINQLFLDPTLVIEKSVDTPVVPLAGGLVTYTLEVSSFGFGPISSLQIFDLLDLALSTVDYVPGSTLITYPDLSQSIADPALSIDVDTGRPRLDWALSPTTLNANQTITVQYSVQIPASTARRVDNEAHAEGSFGGSTFSPLDTAEVVQADLTLTKAVTDDGTPEAGEVLTYTLNVTNNGIAAETNVVITDLIPTNTTFVPASVTTSGPFTGAYNAGQNAVVWTAANFPVGGPHALTFQVMVNPGTASGTVIPNLASYESTQTPLFPSNEVETTLVGPLLVVSKTGPALLHPNETATFEITVNNTGAGSANNVRIVDFFPSNAAYISESMQFRKNVDPLASVTDAADADEGTEFVDRLELLVPSLGSGQSITFRFQVQVNPGTDGQTVNNQATITSDEVAPTFTNLVQIPIVGNADITGHVFLDLDGNGVQNGAEPDLPNLDVVVSETPTDYGCAPASAITDDGYDGSLASMTCCNVVVPAGNYGAAPAITDIDVELALTHTFIGDLTVKLVSPTNQVLTLLNRPASTAPDDGTDTPFGDGTNWNGDVITFDDDGGAPSAETLGSTLTGGQNVCADDGICAYTPAPDTAGGLANLAGYDGSDPRGTWQLCVSDSAAPDPGTFVTGNLIIMSSDTIPITQTVTTDANGDYIATVANTQVSVDVQESDPDFPPGATLTTANDPQNLTAILGGTVAATPVGYQPPPITFTKTSDAVLNQVVPGQTITYTLTITNNSGINQTGIIVTDPLPTGTSAVPGSTVVAIPATAPGGDPPNLVVLGDGYSLAPAGVMTITFQVVVDDPLAGAVTQITNTATVDTDQQGPQNASVIDDVLRLAVTVEPNNAGFAVPGGSVTYSHVVTNTGQEADSYNLTLGSELGYTVELIDPATGTVIATDTDGDGVWDGGITVNTGVLAVGASRNYRVRVNVPLGTAVGTEETTTLTATSTTSATISAFATDETTVVDSLDLGPVALIPDHSGVVVAGDSIAYTHAVINNTGAADTFDLTAFPTLPGWTSTIYNDSNGDGVYSPGLDVAISNTLLLADGQLQTIFVVVDSPGGALPGDTDVVHLTAISQTDPALFDAATDTTTILPATTHDLSGGGTVLVSPSDIAIFPGTIKNLTDAGDRFDFTITASPFFGLDGLDHPTQLWVDTNADGVPDTLAAEDTNGDGTWDTITPGFDTNGDSAPDMLVAAGAELAYELRRPVDAMQLAYRDPITLTATSQATGEMDSITTTNLLAAVTHAMIAGLEVYTVGSQVVLEWRTTLEHGTAGFVVERQAADGTLQSLHRGILPALSKAAAGGTYRFADPSASAGRTFTYVLREMEIDGRSRFLAQREVTIDFQALADPLGTVPASGFSSEAHRPPAPRPASPAVGQASAAATEGDAPERLRLRVQEPGLYRVSAEAIAEALGRSISEIEGLISQGKLRLHQGEDPEPGVDPCPSAPSQPGEIFSDGFESGDLCAWSATFGVPTALDVAWLAAPDHGGIYFYGQGIESIYTDDAIYWLEEGSAVQMSEVPAGAVNPVAGQTFTEVRHFEEESLPVTSVIEDPDSDFWFWSFVAVVPEIGTAVDTITVNLPTPGKAAVSTSANLVLHLQAETEDEEIAEDHSAVIWLNGTQIGTTSWDGSTAHTVSLNFSQSLLQDGDNTLEIKAPADSGIASEIFYLDAVDLSYQRTYQALDDQLTAAAGGHGVLTLEGFSRDDISVFDLTQIEQPRRVIDPRIDSEGGSFQVSFNSSPNSSYLALPLSAAAPLVPEPDEPSDLRNSGNRADYLVIPAAGLEAAAETLAAHRQGQGLETMVVRLQDVYDEFNGGVVSPWALRDFLGHTATWAEAPRFVVLAGDSSFDFKDRLGHGGNLLPAPMTSTPDGLFPSDHRTFDLSGEDGVPEIAVGRLPVRSNDELAQYVAKLVAYEAGLATSESWNQHTVWIADAVDEGGEFINDSELLISPLPDDLSFERIYVDELGAEAARQEILETFDDGALLVNFLGHANLLQMGNGAGLLRNGDVAGFNNGARLPVLSAMTCALGRFDRVFFDTLSEQLVLAPHGGVIALWAPTGFAFNEDGLMLGSGFLPLTLDGPATTLGEAIRATLGAYLEEAEEPRPHVPFTYTLLGDPAIRLRP